MGTYGGGLYQFRQGRAFPVTGIPEKAKVYSLVEHKGNVYVGTESALYKLIESQAHFLVQVPGNAWTLLSKGDTLFIGQRHQELMVLVKGKTFSLRSKRNITHMALDKKGGLWIASKTEGLSCVSDRTLVSFQNAYIRNILCDSLPRYVATWNQGVYYNEQNIWRKIKGAPAPATVLKQRGDTVFAGTWNNGVYLYKQGQLIDSLHTANSGIRDNHISDIAFDEKSIWFATNRGFSRVLF